MKGDNDKRTPYLYNGKELDDVTGLYYYGARYYDPITSIWENVDPSWDLPQQVDESPYAYVGNNPVVFFDPDGRVRYFGQGGVFNLMGYGRQPDKKVNGIDFSFLNKFKTPSNVFDLVTKQNQRQQEAKAGTLSTYSGTSPAILNNANKKQGRNYYVTISFLDIVEFSTAPKDNRTKTQKRQEKQQMYMSNLQKALARPAFMSALKTFTQMRARNMRAK